MGSWGDKKRKWDAEDIEKDRERKTEKRGQCVPYVSPTRACMFGFWSTDDIILQAPFQSESAAVEKPVYRLLCEVHRGCWFERGNIKVHPWNSRLQRKKVEFVESFLSALFRYLLSQYLAIKIFVVEHLIYLLPPVSYRHRQDLILWETLLQVHLCERDIKRNIL